MQERKCFVCEGFVYIAYYYRNRREIEEKRRVEVGGPEWWPSSNQFEVLTSSLIQAEIPNKEGITMESLLDSRMTVLVISS